MRSVQWLPLESEREETTYQRPWLEAPSPYDGWYREPPVESAQENEEEGSRVIIIDM